MKHLTIAALLLTTACATVPPQLCDREAQEWNKFDTQEDQCATTATERHPTRPPVVKRPRPNPDPEPPVSGPEDEPPVDEPPVDEPEGEPEGDDTEEDGATKPKSDNSDANGKGGNSHDREDKTHGGTEEAEDKKD